MCFPSFSYLTNIFFFLTKIDSMNLLMMFNMQKIEKNPFWIILVPHSTCLQTLELRSQNCGLTLISILQRCHFMDSNCIIFGPQPSYFYESTSSDQSKGRFQGGQNFAPPQGTSVISDVRVRRVKLSTCTLSGLYSQRVCNRLRPRFENTRGQIILKV